MSEFYAGSRLLEPFSNLIGVSVDQFNFVVCQLLAIVLSSPLQRYLPACPQNSDLRYAAHLIIGLALSLFCFGYQTWHLLFQSGVSLLILKYFNHQQSRYYVFIFVLGYLSLCHIFRMYYDYSGFHLDITGPLMILTQRLSSFAFCLSDGKIELKEGKPLAKSNHHAHAVKCFPSILQYFSYMLYFQGIMVGPFIFYSDYKNYISGKLEKYCVSAEEATYFRKNQHSLVRPSNLIRKLTLCALFHLFIYLVLLPAMPIDYYSDDEFEQASFAYKWYYVFVASFLVRNKYYFAFGLGMLAHLCSGMGFSGFRERTRDKEEEDLFEPSYDIVKHYDLWNIEFGSSIKVKLDNWNCKTAIWLREVIYDRISPKYNTLAVFTTSAFWHGFYPGYYLCFGTLFLATIVSRKLRQLVRPHTQANKFSRTLYDVFTMIISMGAMNFAAGPFILLEFYRGLRFWSSMYFSVLLILILLHFGLPFLSRRSRATVPVTTTPTTRIKDQ